MSKTVVRIWRPKLSFGEGSSVSSANFGFDLSWGHASLELFESRKGSEPSAYMSYWPPDMVAGKHVYSYEEDVEVMEREASVSVTILDLDVAAMESTWEKELDQEFSNRGHNCCTVAARVLRAGYSAGCFRSVGDFLSRSVKELVAAVRNPLTTFLSGVSQAQGLLVWEPDSVEKLAKHLKAITD